MIITCPHCSMRLQLDDAKVPEHLFTLRCPKCQNILSIKPPPDEFSEDGAHAAADSDSFGQGRRDGQASSYPLDSTAEEMTVPRNENGSSEVKELVRMLGALLKRGGSPSDHQRGASRYGWENRHVLICVGEQHREVVARTLLRNDYQIFVAKDKGQAIEQMREERIDVLVLEDCFDPEEKGAAHIAREVNSMRPSERRRLFLVQLDDEARTSDAHAAFVRNVGLLFNPVDMVMLPRSLDRAMRDYNDLYRGFNKALGLGAL